MKYIANYENTTGYGETLEDAFDDLEEAYGGVPKDEVNFYEITPLKVEFKIIKKAKPVKVTR